MKIAIVGAGIAGLSTAWALTKRGHDVTLIEQAHGIPNPLAASGDHHRIIRRAYPAGTYAGAITEAYEAWDEMWADLGAVHHDPRGFLCVSRSAGDEAEEYREGLEAGGFAFDLHDADEAVRRWPFLRREGMRYAYFSKEGGALHCRRIAAGLAAWLRDRGATVLVGGRVRSIDAERGLVRVGSTTEFEADLIVVTAGAWVTKLFPDVAGDLKTFRTAVAYLDPPPGLQDAWSAAPVILDVGDRIDGYIIPPTGGAGLKFGTGMHKEPTGDADADRVPRDGEGGDILRHFAPAMARIGEYRVREVVTCAYTFTSDERFFATGRGRCLLVSACSGHGYKFGAAVGRRVADHVERPDLPRLVAWLRAEAA